MSIYLSLSVSPQHITSFQNTSAPSGAFQDFKSQVTPTVSVRLEMKRIQS